MTRSAVRRPSHHLTVVALVLAVLALPAAAAAEMHESTVAQEIEALILEDNAHIRENLMDRQGGISQHGSLEFWSSGGLMQEVAPEAVVSEYDVFTIRPKHIRVIELPGGEAAVAMYYSEGSMKLKDGAAVDNYLTRVLQVFVKEDGEWVARAAHWSPIAGGSGTRQTAVD